MDVYLFMLTMCRVEEACVRLRKTTCTGSFVQGHTPKQVLTPDELREVWAQMDRISAAMDDALDTLGVRP